MSARVPDLATQDEPDQSAIAWLERVESVMAGMTMASHGFELDALAESIVVAFDAAWVRIWLFEPYDDALHLRANAGFSDLPAGVRTRIPRQDPDSPVIAALLRGETVILDDISSDSGVRWAEWLVVRGVRSYAGFPLRVEGRLVGVMAVLGWSPWSPTALAALRLLTRQAALAIEHTRLYARAREDARRTRTLAETAASVTVSGSSDRVLTDLAARVVESSGAQACAIFVMDSDMTSGRLAGMHGLPPEYARAMESAMQRGRLTFTLDELEPDRPIVRHNVWETYLATPVFAHLREYRTRVTWDMTVIVPLVTRGRKHGILATYYHHDQEPDQDERTFLAAIGNQAAIAVENARLLVTAQEKASLEERARLARDLHDSATQTVFSMGLLAQAAERQYERGAPQLATTLQRVAGLAKQAHAELRALLIELRPVVALEHGLEQGLRHLVNAVQARSTADIALVGDCPTAVPLEQAGALFRIVQEALNNAVKHAQAGRVTVTLQEQQGALRVSIVDDGVGFDTASLATRDQGHLGLRSMRERAAAAGLTLNVSSTPGYGATVVVVAPAAPSRT